MSRQPTAFVVRVRYEEELVFVPVAILLDIDAAKLHAEQVCQSRRGFKWERTTDKFRGKSLRHLTLVEGTRAIAYVTECPLIQQRVVECPPDPGTLIEALSRDR